MQKSALLWALVFSSLAACGTREEAAPPPAPTLAAVVEKPVQPPTQPDVAAGSATPAVVEPAPVQSPAVVEPAPVQSPAVTAVTAEGVPAATSSSGTDGQVREPSGDDLGYDLGRQLGEQTARSAWKTLSPNGDCAAVDKLGMVLTRASGRILSAAPSDEAKLDYAEGYVHGLRAALADVAGSCAANCAALCQTATSAGTAVLCEAQRVLGGSIVLRRLQQAPAIPCAEAPAGCDKGPTGVRPGDCP